MAGEGFMQMANTIMKNNSGLLRRKRVFEGDVLGVTTKTELTFKTYSEKELERVKEAIRAKAKQERRRFNSIAILTVIAVIMGFYMLFSEILLFTN